MTTSTTTGFETDEATGLPIHPRTGLVAVGVVGGRPVWPILGGSGADEDDDDGEEIDVDAGDGAGSADEDEEDDGEGEGDKDEEYTPPSREEWERVQAALAKANDEAKKRRLALREAKKKAATEAEAAVAKTTRTTAAADKKALDDAVAKAAKETEDRLKPGLVRAEAKAGLIQRGLDPETSDARLTKLLRTLDMDDIEVDGDGGVDGLADQLDEIAADFPELFTKEEAPATKPKPRPRIDPAGKRKPAQTQPKTSGAKHAARILGTKQRG
jgi:hypothetical protein